MTPSKWRPFRFFLMTLIGLWLIVANLWAAPLTERLPSSSDAPLDILSTQATQLLVPRNGNFKDRFLIVLQGSNLKIVDTETWELYTYQPESLNQSLGGAALLANGNSLILTLEDGDLARIELDQLDDDGQVVEEGDEGSTSTEDETTDVLDPRIEDISDRTGGGPLGPIAADPTAGSQVVYFINNSEPTVFRYDFEEETLGSISLDGVPNDIVWAQTTSGDRLFMPSSDGRIFVLNVGGSLATTLNTPVVEDLEDDPNLEHIAVTPDGEYLYVVDVTNDVVWVIDGASQTFLDQHSATGVSPVVIDSDENGSLTDVLLVEVNDPDSTYGYVSGEEGITVIAAGSPESSSATRKIVDQDEGTEDVFDPIITSGSPGPLAASSADDGYVYSSNGDSSISVISENPFLSLDDSTAISLGASETTFDLTFQSDEAGTYRVVLNSDVTGESGTELIGDTELTSEEINTNVTTATIDTADFDRDDFPEGTNRVFVFLVDAEGNQGRDAMDIMVDRPPEGPTIKSVNFGNGRAYITFEKLDDSDIKNYLAAAKLALVAAADVSSGSCPDTLDFTTGLSGVADVKDDACGNPCTIEIDGLENGSVYCLGVRAEDDSSQEGAYSIFATSVTPEATVGPAELLGESGSCSVDGSRKFNLGFLVLFLPLLLWSFRRPSVLIVVIFCTMPVIGHAQDSQVTIIGSNGEVIVGSSEGYVASETTYVARSKSNTQVREEPVVLEKGETISSAQPIGYNKGYENADSQKRREVNREHVRYSDDNGKRRKHFIDNSEDGEPIVEERYHHPNRMTARWDNEKSSFSFELKGAFWLPSNNVVEDFFGGCCNLSGELEFGWLYKKQLNITVSTGAGHQSGQAVGATSGAASGDSVGLLMIPIRNDVLYRFDYQDEQILVPYVGGGMDYVFFRENIAGSTTKGWKVGFHGRGGVAILLDKIQSIGDALYNAGIDDIYFTVEGRYSQIDSFSSSGLDLSGISIYFGLMMAF